MKAGYLFSVMLLCLFCSCHNIGGGDNANAKKTIDSLQDKITLMNIDLNKYKETAPANKSYLDRFDSVDFIGFGERNLAYYRSVYAPDVKVLYSDGGTANTVDEDIAHFKRLLDAAPDARISEHAMQFGAGDHTCAVSYLQGTFTQPLSFGDKQILPPTGKAFKLTLCTVCRWQDGKIVEKSVFWDNNTLQRSLGLPGGHGGKGQGGEGGKHGEQPQPPQRRMQSMPKANWGK